MNTTTQPIGPTTRPVPWRLRHRKLYYLGTCLAYSLWGGGSGGAIWLSLVAPQNPRPLVLVTGLMGLISAGILLGIIAFALLYIIETIKDLANKQ